MKNPNVSREDATQASTCVATRAFPGRVLVVRLNRRTNIIHGMGAIAALRCAKPELGKVAFPLNCSVGELIAVTRRAALFIAGDSGHMPLAAALHVPVIALFSPTNPEGNDPFGTPSVVWRSPESIYNQSQTHHPDAGRISLEPQPVIEVANQLLGEYCG